MVIADTDCAWSATWASCRAASWIPNMYPSTHSSFMTRVMKDEWVLGDIFGIHDAALHDAQVADQAQSVSAITMSFIQLASAVNDGSEAIRSCLKLQQAPMFV